MPTPSKTLIDLERKFWQAIVDQDADTATDLLTEPALMVSAHGAMKFDHAGYRKMAEKGSMVLTSYELSDMNVVFPNDSTAVLTYRVKQKVSQRDNGKDTVQEMNDTSTWVRQGDDWRCVVHTETPSGASH
jgi:ketosteroid isomerase-like protein